MSRRIQSSLKGLSEHDSNAHPALRAGLFSCRPADGAWDGIDMQRGDVRLYSFLAPVMVEVGRFRTFFKRAKADEWIWQTRDSPIPITDPTSFIVSSST